MRPACWWDCNGCGCCEEFQEYYGDDEQEEEEDEYIMKELSESVKMFNELSHVSDFWDGDHISFDKDELVAKLEDLLDTPKHETVEQWEKRTGESYPDDGPVWWRYETCDNDEPWKHHIYSIRHSFKNSKLQIIVANHHGKPEER